MPPPILSKRGLSLDRLASFCAVVEAGSFVAAAKRDPNRQSQFSRQIKDLEQVLGTKLFVREGKLLKLTVAGQRLAAMTEGYFAGLEELEEDVRENLRPLTLGSGESVQRWVLLPKLADVLAAADGSRVDFRGMRTDDIVRQLRDGELDVGILRSDAALDEELEAAPLYRQDFVLMAPRFALPEKTAGAIGHLRTLPVAMLSGDGKFVQVATKLAAESGITLNSKVAVESFSLVIQAAKTLAIAAFVPLQASGEFPADQYAPLPLKGITSLSRELSVAVNRRSAVVRERPRRFALRLVRAFDSASGSGAR